jgi:hypothetical protein
MLFYSIQFNDILHYCIPLIYFIRTKNKGDTWSQLQRAVAKSASQSNKEKASNSMPSIYSKNLKNSNSTGNLKKTRFALPTFDDEDDTADFNIKNMTYAERRSALPISASSTSSLKNSDREKNSLITTQTLSATISGTYSLSDSDISLIKRYSVEIIDLCRRCYEKMKHCWTETITEFKSQSIKGMKGKIVDHYFHTILRNRGVVLTVWEPPKITQAFHAFGMNGVSDFMEFLRVCQLTA